MLQVVGKAAYFEAKRISTRSLCPRYAAVKLGTRACALSSAGVSWRTLIGYPSYARNRACALPSPTPIHYVMAKIVPAMQLAAHAKSSTLSVVGSQVQTFSA